MLSFTLQTVITRQELPIWLLFITSLGFLTILKKTTQTIKWIYVTFIRPSKNLKTTYGSWAIVTGATDGIGRAFACQLAREGLNVILVGRNAEKLHTVSDQIKADYPESKVKTVVVDFSGDDVAKSVEAIEAAIEGLEVGVLINNVGVTYPKAMYFHEVEESVWKNIVRVNLEGTTRVTRSVIPAMIRRRKGAIVFIGSGAAIVVPSHPLYTIYAATKAYIDQFSRCLSMEYKSCGIDVQCQVPLYVATKMVCKVASIEKSSLFIPSADDYARAGIRSIGFEHCCTPYWAHSVQWFFASMLSDNTLDEWRLAIGLRRRLGDFSS